MEKVVEAEKAGDNARTYEAIKAVLAADPIHQEAIQRLVALRIREGRYDDAISTLRKYVELYHESQAFVQLSELCCHIGDYAAAGSAMDEVLLLEPHNFYVWQYAGEIALMRRNAAFATRCFLTACKLSDYLYARALRALLAVLATDKDAKQKHLRLVPALTAKLAALRRPDPPALFTQFD